MLSSAAAEAKKQPPREDAALDVGKERVAEADPGTPTSAASRAGSTTSSVRIRDAVSTVASCSSSFDRKWA